MFTVSHYNTFIFNDQIILFFQHDYNMYKYNTYTKQNTSICILHNIILTTSSASY